MIGGIVMLAMSPPEMCKMMNSVQVPGFTTEVDCSAMPEKLEVWQQVIGSLGVVFVFGCTVLLCLAAKAMRDENGKRIRQFYQLLWFAFYAGILCNTILLIVGLSMNSDKLNDENVEAAKKQADRLPGALAIGIVGAVIGSLVALYYMLSLRTLVIDTNPNDPVPSPCPCLKCCPAKHAVAPAKD